MNSGNDYCTGEWLTCILELVPALHVCGDVCGDLCVFVCVCTVMIVSVASELKCQQTTTDYTTGNSIHPPSTAV